MPMVVTGGDVIAAIEQANSKLPAGTEPLSARNPQNFFKDFIRKTTCNVNWPKRLKTLRITARQRYGDQLVMEFIPYPDGDDLPFPDRFEPGPELPEVRVEALSLPRAARALGRRDEAWLTQIVVYQRVMHHHLAVFSNAGVVDLSHLQMSVKTQPEIDALFLATRIEEGKDTHAFVICEAKQRNERILENQIREQIGKAFAEAKKLKQPIAITAVIPLVAKAVSYAPEGAAPKWGIYLAEFQTIRRVDFEKLYSSAEKLHELPLTLVSSAFYRFSPEIKGIS